VDGTPCLQWVEGVKFVFNYFTMIQFSMTVEGEKRGAFRASKNVKTTLAMALNGY
jgi:hypothetical protein